MNEPTRMVGLLGAGRQAIETAGYLQQSGRAIAFYFEMSPPSYQRTESDYDAPILGPGDSQALGGVPVLSAVGDPDVRRRLVEFSSNASFTSVVSAESWSALNVTIGVGCTVAPFAALNRWVRVGEHVLVNVGAIVSHDVVVGDFTTLAPGCRIGGGCVIGAGAYVGIGATILDHITVGNGAVIGAGAVVVNDVPDDAVVIGVPARLHRVRQR